MKLSYLNRKTFARVVIVFLSVCSINSCAENRLLSYHQYNDDQFISKYEIFSKHYNTFDFRYIYSMCSPDLKSGASFDVVNALLLRIQENKGKLIKIVSQETTANLSRFTIEAERGRWIFKLTLSVKGEIDAFEFEDYPLAVEAPKRNSVRLSLPFEGKWTVLWGGKSLEDNYHVSLAQNNKFSTDFLILDKEGKAFKSEGKSNTDYFAFGQSVLAAADGEIVIVIDGVPDNPPQTANPTMGTGNSITIKHANNEYTSYEHLAIHSALVKAGDKVVKGKVIGSCGNSGNTSLPHLHFNVATSELPQLSTSIPQIFSDVLLYKGKIKQNILQYSPVRNDTVENK